MAEIGLKDYSLTGESNGQAIERGLASATWYTTPIPREKMRELLVRSNGPAIRDTLIWVGILLVSGIAGYLLWGTWWAVIPFAIYGVFYGSASESRWHECSHGTPFKTDWMNNVVYEVASFMCLFESTVWRWSHTRHHSDTIIVGRDPEISVPRPPDIKGMWVNIFILALGKDALRKMVIHACGELTADERAYIPQSEHKRVYRIARIYLLILGAVIGWSVYLGSFLPLMYIGLPSFYGGWLRLFHSTPQHAGLAENVLDHRLNCRTVYLNSINRFIYWNMNYHIEHHMFPLVPYHALPKLHALIKHDLPPTYPNMAAAYREIIPALRRQVKEPDWFVERELPIPTAESIEHGATKIITSTGHMNAEGWHEVCGSAELHKEDVLQFDHDEKTFAIYRNTEGEYFATDGMCTHGNTHLAGGLVKGDLVECPKHNGRFNIKDGAPRRAPVCVGLRTYPIQVEDDKIWIDLSTHEDVYTGDTYTFNVVSNDNVATFIKELVLEPVTGSEPFHYTPGDYLQLDIPPYEMTFDSIEVQAPYRSTWKQDRLFNCRAANPRPVRRNYSMATNSRIDTQLRFTARIATPPLGLACNAGVGSSYVFNLKPGDTVTAIGPFGDFHPKDSDQEMVYLGGGSGMAPLRAHLSYLFETLKTTRRVSFWYGARSLQELFYQDYFEELAKKHENFTFHVALSEPLEQDGWTSHTGFIHEVLQQEYLGQHLDFSLIEYYFCGPPPMIKAATAMLGELNVAPEQIAYDEF